MNRSIRYTATFSLVLTLILLINLTWVQAFQTEKYAENPRNRRQFIAMKSIHRGNISTAGQILARSVPNEDGLFVREYVTDPLSFGPVEGYASDIYGTAGLERSYNAILNGTDPKLFTSTWKDKLLGKQPQGANLELTLLPEVQRTAFEELASKNYEGAAVALRPSTGEILAMASTPSYNPALIADDETAESTWSQLLNDPGAPLLNHATQEPLPPGSTFKVITTAAALAKGYGPGSVLTAAPDITLPGTTTTLENYDGMRCGEGDTTTLLNAFTLSCNTAFAEMGMAVGAEELRATAQAFGFEDSYDIGLDMDKGTIGDLADDASVGQSSIGQRDIATTVLENAVVAATVANEGKRMKPYLVSKIVGPNLEELSATEPEQLNEAITPEVAATLTELMQSSERHTVGYNGSDIASKTGTAEHGADSRNSNPHAWYIAFSPSADVAVAVVVKNGGDRGQAATGGSVAAPIGRAIIDAARAAATAMPNRKG